MSAFASGPDLAGLGPIAQQQADGVEQVLLPAPVSPDGVQTRQELDAQGVDDGKSRTRSSVNMVWQDRQSYPGKRIERMFCGGRSSFPIIPTRPRIAPDDWLTVQ
jgi:hypothetical protein